LIYPSADTIEDRVGSRYSLVVLAAKRAKQIKEGSPVLIETASTNPLTIALEEIAAGKVTIQQAPAIPPADSNVPEVDNYHVSALSVETAEKTIANQKASDLSSARAALGGDADFDDIASDEDGDTTNEDADADDGSAAE
jgi:DNA-directed RNA polymerase subunit omega